MLVSAPAGSGKTALLAEWLAVGNPPGAVARVPLGHETDGWRAFWDAVAAVVPGGAASREALADLGEPVVLVLDDFHLIRSPEVVADLDWLVDSEEGRVHVLLLTRSDPPLRLERLRLSGRMSELRAVDLAFTLPETDELLSGLELPDTDVELLWRRTEGWVGGLRLAQLSLERSIDRHGFVASFSGDDRAVSDYLTSEVVDQQPADTLDFLLRTCVADRLTGELADALTGRRDGERTLRGLERQVGLVAASDGHGHWYRYHPLLLEVLRAESRRRLADQQAELHRRAARWHADEGSALDAARHAVDGGDWELAADVLGEHWLGALTRGGGPALLELCERIPADAVRGDGELALALAGLRLAAGDDTGVDRLLDEAFRLAQQLPERRARRFGVTSAAISLYRARLRGDVEGALDAARSALDAEWSQGLGVEIRALTLANLGIAEFWSGASDAASEHMQQAAGLALKAANDFLLFLAESYAAAVDAQSGRLREAAARAEHAVELAKRRDWARVPDAAMGYAALAAAHLWRGELLEAERLADRAVATVAGSSDPLLGPAVSLLRAGVLALRGEPLRALDFVRGATAHDPSSRLLRVSASLLEADLWLALGEPDRARRVLVDLDPFDAAVGMARLQLAEGDPREAAATIAAYLADDRDPLIPFARVEARVLDAIAHDALRDEPGAMAALERALDMAEARGCSMAIARYGAPLRSLLRRVLSHGTRHRALADELLSLLARDSAPAPATAGPLLEPLSERELTVLRYLPTMMSNAEIAAEMYVSVNTVKTHLKHVYRKLDVTDRRECVRRGRELRLLSPGLGE
jgi:LuxR family transcriptional regulator, maltose regulon positive regulatory protein